MPLTDSPAAKLSLIGGVLCLDFANTVGDHAGEHPHEMLGSYEDLLAWSRHAGILDDGLVRALQAEAERDRDLAQHSLLRAIELREAIYAIFAAIAQGRAPDRRRLITLNQELAESHARLRVVPVEPTTASGRIIPLPSVSEIAGSGRRQPRRADSSASPPAATFQLAWPVPTVDLGVPCWPIAYSAAQLLASGRLDRVRQCAGDECGWLFLDTSRNHSRRWCDMADCGNRAKARRHYRRTHAGASAG